MEQRCSCGHDKPVHEHWRSGSDCALCSCPRYRVDKAALAAAALGSLRRGAARVVNASSGPRRRQG